MSLLVSASSVAASCPSGERVPPDTGILQVINKAKEGSPNDANRAVDAIVQQVGSAKPAPNPAYRDVFGIPVNPSSLLPAYVVGTHEAMNVLVDTNKIILASVNDDVKRTVFSAEVNAYYMANDLLTEYKLRSSVQPLSDEDRNKYITAIGELWNRNDYRLHQFFGADTIRPDVKDGTVRAKVAMDKIDADLKESRIKDAARSLYNTIQNSSSYYKNLSLNEIECRIRESGADKAGDDRRTQIQLNKAIAHNLASIGQAADLFRRMTWASQHQIPGAAAGGSPAGAGGSVAPSPAGTLGTGGSGNGSGIGGNGSGSSAPQFQMREYYYYESK